MTRRYLAFDLEISKSIPDGCKDWKEHRPLGITCAAMWASDEDKPLLWHSIYHMGAMLPEDNQNLVWHLADRVAGGYTILTHNGTSFDFDVLAEESGLFSECRELALNAVDTMLHFHALKGFPVGLDAICKGMRLPGKPEGMTGAKAPELWAAGEYQTVLDYVANDVRMTLDVALACEKRKGIEWITKRGSHNVVTMERWLTVRECLALPEPDQSWMTNPMKRADMVAWMQRETV